MDQLTAERREEIGHVLRVERLQPGRGRFRVRQIGAPPLLRAFGGDRQAGDPVRHLDPALARALEPVDEHVALLCDRIDRERYRRDQDQRNEHREHHRCRRRRTVHEPRRKLQIQRPQRYGEYRRPHQWRQKAGGRPQRKRHQDEGEHDAGVRARTRAKRKGLLIFQSSSHHARLLGLGFLGACFHRIRHGRRLWVFANAKRPGADGRSMSPARRVDGCEPLESCR
jgi:hypothetical protein